MVTKLPKIGTTIFATMGQMVREHNAINLAQGFPDFPCSEELISLTHYYMKTGCNQYSPMEGILPLRQKITEKIKFLYDVEYNPVSEVTMTAGATEAVYATITSVVNTGDEVIVFEPAFDSYSPVIELNGGIPVYVQLQYPDFKIHWEEVGEKITDKTKLIIINSPHNPSGAVLNKEDLETLANLVKGTDILILSDEVYEHIIFDGLPHESFILHPELRKRSFVLFSFGKTFHTTGWRMGYCVAPENLTKEFRKIHQYLTFSTATPMQFALADYLDNKEHYLELPDFFQEKRDKLLQFLKASRFEFIPTKGTYFQLLSYKNISDQNDLDFSYWLVKEMGVASIPLSPFYHNKKDEKIIRVCFAKLDETLEKAAVKLCKI